MTRRCSFITSSYSSVCLRARKCCSSTLRCALAICFDSRPASIGSSLPSTSTPPRRWGGLLRQQARLDRLLVALHVAPAEAVEDPVDAIAGEQPDQVVLGRQEETALARVALASRAPAQLVVDPPRLVAFGADDVEAAGVDHALAVLLEARLEGRQQLGEL